MTDECDCPLCTAKLDARNGEQTKQMMNIVTLDFETYFDRDYTLKKMTTEEYIRDPRFEAHGVALSFNGGVPSWQLKPPGIDWKQTAVLCHHAHFDGLILAHHYGIVPALYLDTLSMARALLGNHLRVGLEHLASHFGLAAKSVPYEAFQGRHWHELGGPVQDAVSRGACHDVSLTWDIFQRLAKFFPAREYALVDATVCMFTKPVLVGDTDRLTATVRDELQQRQELLDELQVTATDLGSDAIFARLLEAEGVELATKTTEKGNEKYAFASTDSFMRDLQDDANPRVAALACARLATKSSIVRTRAQRLRDMSTRGRMSVYLTPYGAHTTRWSGGDKLNWQNFPRDSDLGRAIKAPEGHACVVSDASQIECRLLNYVAGQWDVIERFAKKEDPYIGIASLFYGHDVYKPKPGDVRYQEMEAKRGTGKQLELSCGYGAGGPTIKATAAKGTYGPPVHISDEDALRARDLYRSTHPAVTALWASANDVLKWLARGEDFDWAIPSNPHFIIPVRNRRLMLPTGLFINYESLHWHQGEEEQGWRLHTRKGHVRIYGAKVVENLIQALSRCHIAEVWLRCQQSGMRFVSMEHDKLIAVEPLEAADSALHMLQEEMRKPPSWAPGIPLDSEGYVSSTFKREGK